MIAAMRAHAPRLQRYNVASYFQLADAGLVADDEKVELLDGLIVAMAPQSPLHASAMYYVDKALRDAFPRETVIRTQAPFIASDVSVPEPDFAVVPGEGRDYIDAHPRSAVLMHQRDDRAVGRAKAARASAAALA